MAVVLCRSDGKALPVAADLRNAPQVRVKSKPPLALSHQGKKIRARSGAHYTGAEREREEVWRETYDRRRIQQTSCGFHGPANRPYHDVGGLVLDDRRLILEGLGQLEGSQEPVEEQPSPEKAQGIRNGPVVVPTGRVQLRARTSSQFPTELFNLESEGKLVEKRLDLIRKGQGLFKLMSDHRESKQAALEQAAHVAAEAQKSEWKEAEVASDISVHGNDLHDEQTAVEAHQPRSSTTSEVPLVTLEETGMASESAGEGVVGDGSEGVEEEEMEEEGRKGHDKEHHDDIVDQWFRQLCVLLWVLEALQMETPAHMPQLAQYWKINRPPAKEALGKRVAERNRALLQQWDGIVKQTKKPVLRSKLPPAGNPRRVGKVSRQQTPQNLSRSATVSPSPPQVNATSPKAKRDHDPQAQTQKGSALPHPLMQSKSPSRRPKQSVHNPPSLSRKSTSQRMEEQGMRRQKRLTATQMGSLLTMLEEELNYSKKKSRSRIRAFQRETDKSRTQVEIPGQPQHLPPVTLDVSRITRRFSEAEERKKMIAHEQISAMDRDRQKALEQRFSHLQVSGKLWRDLEVMREGVEIESTAMARKKLLMNYDWYSDLLSLVPMEVKCNRYCHQLLVSLGELAQYTYTVGPKMLSKRRLIQVLGSLRPWELRSPEIAEAVEFLITKVIYIVAEDYRKWLEQHTALYYAKVNSSPIKN